MPLGKVSVKSNNAELALSTLTLGRKQEGGKKGADREKEDRKRQRQRGNKKSLEGGKKQKQEDYKQTFHLGKPSFNQLLAALRR